MLIHGRSRYLKGCKCPTCTLENREYNRFRAETMRMRRAACPHESYRSKSATVEICRNCGSTRRAA